MGSTTPPLDTRLPHLSSISTTLSQKDTLILSKPDSAHHYLTWPEIRTLVSQNRLDEFARVPSQLRRYLESNERLRREYGSVMRFVVGVRLRWGVEGCGGKERANDGEGEVGGKMVMGGVWNRGDVRVLRNDWPYGVEEGIVHLVVWTKFKLDEDPATEDLTADAREAIEKFVDRVFVERAGKENVIWFKNWKTLKSVHAVEHFHVMLNNPDMAFVDEVTNGDVPLSERV